MTANSRKILVPLATLLAAGAIAVGSGATLTSTSNSSASVTAGTLLHTNNHDGSVMDVANIKPGDTVSGTVVITNDGILDAILSLQETGEQRQPVHRRRPEAEDHPGRATPTAVQRRLRWLDNTVHDLGELDAATRPRVTFTVSMPLTRATRTRARPPGATYQWVTTQKAPAPRWSDWR